MTENNKQILYADMIDSNFKNQIFRSVNFSVLAGHIWQDKATL